MHAEHTDCVCHVNVKWSWKKRRANGAAQIAYLEASHTKRPTALDNANMVEARHITDLIKFARRSTSMPPTIQHYKRQADQKAVAAVNGCGAQP